MGGSDILADHQGVPLILKKLHMVRNMMYCCIGFDSGGTRGGESDLRV